MQNAFIASIAATVNVPTSAVVIYTATSPFRRSLLDAEIHYTVTTTSAIIPYGDLTTLLTSTVIYSSLAKALVSYGVTDVILGGVSSEISNEILSMKNNGAAITTALSAAYPGIQVSNPTFVGPTGSIPGVAVTQNIPTGLTLAQASTAAFVNAYTQVI